jgi:cell division protein ZapA
MTHVTVTINGKAYRMACDEGQEDHLVGLAERFDRQVSKLRGAFGEIGDQRLTVMAGITVTDELNELERRIGKLESEIEGLKAGQADLLGNAHAGELALAGQLDAATARIEELARRLTASVAVPAVEDN